MSFLTVLRIFNLHILPTRSAFGRIKISKTARLLAIPWVSYNEIYCGSSDKEHNLQKQFLSQHIVQVLGGEYKWGDFGFIGQKTTWWANNWLFFSWWNKARRTLYWYCTVLLLPPYEGKRKELTDPLSMRLGQKYKILHTWLGKATSMSCNIIQLVWYLFTYRQLSSSSMRRWLLGGAGGLLRCEGKDHITVFSWCSW